MAKEMSHDFDADATEELASKVLITKRAVPLPNSEQRSEEAPLKSGVGKIDAGLPGKTPPRRPLPIPPRVKSRVPEQVAREPETSETQSEVRSSEKTQVYRPNLSEPQVRPSALPTARPQLGAALGMARDPIPKPPKVPTIVGAARQQRTTAPIGHVSGSGEEQKEEQTRVCPAAVIENLLKKEDSVTVDAIRSAADEVTRVGEVPIEELAMAERKLVSSAVGHEDVTRAYSFNLNDPPSQITAPGKRQLQAEARAEPLVIIQTSRPRRGWRLAVASLLLASVCAGYFGWRYRATLSRHARSWQTSFLRGVSAVTRQPKRVEKTPPVQPPISLSISVSPADALLTIDGIRVANPFVAQKTPDKLAHDLLVEAPGYVPLQRRVQFDRDLTVVLALAPMPIEETLTEKTVEQATSASVSRKPDPTPAARTQKPLSRTAPAKPETPDAPAACRPPYVIDSNGIKTYKPECL